MLSIDRDLQYLGTVNAFMYIYSYSASSCIFSTDIEYILHGDVIVVGLFQVSEMVITRTSLQNC